MPELCSTSSSYSDLPDPVSPPSSALLSSYGLHKPSLLYLIRGREDQSWERDAALRKASQAMPFVVQKGHRHSLSDTRTKALVVDTNKKS